MADLFTARNPARPVYVLDRDLLDAQQQRLYDQTMVGPIKGAVASAKKQLTKTRDDYPETTLSIMVLVNNGNTALDHDEILELVGRRARNDTSKIDGVVVAGAYLHSDGIETLALWPIDYVPIHLDRNFREFGALRSAFHGYSTRAMTAAILHAPSNEMTKRPLLDSGFELGGKTFIKPAPPLGRTSNFYTRGRPRLNSTGIEKCPPVGLTFPELRHSEWLKFREVMTDDPLLGDEFNDWLTERERALKSGTSLLPLVPITVTFDDWMSNLNGEVSPKSFRPVCEYATTLFQSEIKEVIEGARDLDSSQLIPSQYVLAVTEQIGQDEANDVSHIALVDERPGLKSQTISLAENLRIFHDHAVALGAAYALKHRVGSLRWKKDITYSWR